MSRKFNSSSSELDNSQKGRAGKHEIKNFKMTLENAPSKKVTEYIAFVAIIVAVCFFVTYPIIRWIKIYRYSYCRTRDCLDMAIVLRKSMDPNTPPCTNFYKHVCGRWERAYKYLGSQQEVFKYNYEKKVKSALKSVGVSNATQQTAVQKAATLFRACRMINNLEQSSAIELTNFLKTLKINWPGGTTDENIDILDLVVELSLTYKINTLFSVSIGTDTIGALNIIISAPVEELTFPFTIMKDRGSWRERVIRILELFNGQDLTETVLQIDFDMMSKLESILNPEMAQDMIEIPVRDMGTHTPNLQGTRWLNAINKQLPSQKALNMETIIVIINPRLLDILAGFVVQLQDQKSLAGYIGWMVVRILGSTTSYKISTILHGDPSYVDEEACLKTVAEFMPFALLSSRILGIDVGKTREGVKRLTNNILRSYQDSIRLDTFLDERTKAMALLKTVRMFVLYGVPVYSTNNSSLNQLYSYLPAFSGDYVSIAVAVRYYSQEHLKAYLFTAAHANVHFLWNDAARMPLTVSYLRHNNKLVIPISTASIHMFDIHLPYIWNYAGLGSIIAREIAKAYDVEGSKYDEFGVMVKDHWWSNASLKLLNIRSYCFLKEVSAWSRGRLSGILSLEEFREYIASYLGLVQALQAYNRYVIALTTRRRKLKGLEYLTPQQMFFFSYCFKWCGRSGPTELVLEFGCNFALLHMKEFTEAFSCDQFDAMYYQTTCLTQ